MLKDIVIYFIKIFIFCIYGHYGFIKILNINKIKMKERGIILITDFILCLICTNIKFYIDQFLSWFLLIVVNSLLWSFLLKKRTVSTIIVNLISYAICIICFEISIIIEFGIYKTIGINNNFINLAIIVVIQYIFIKCFFKIKKLRNGLDFLNKKIDSDFTDVFLINISTAVVAIYCFMGAIVYDEMTKNILSAFIMLGLIMFIMIQKSFSMYYKQKLLQDNLTQYKQDLAEKDQEIQKLKSEKYSISKITHEFYNRQKALELAVKTNTKNTELINRIHNLTEEYSNELTNIKMPDKLQETGIPEIDDMFKYMQQECIENNIKFQLKIEGDIYYLINNIIPKNKLETLIGDHIRDAINAVSVESVKNKEILVIMGIKENKYELCIYDTGVEFKKDTLLKLGLENVTTNKNRGGKGIGFITTFETLNETGGSLIIEEFAPEKDRIYTKAVKIRFDNKKEYRIISYRADEIIEKNKRMDIVIEDNLTF